MGGEGLAGGGAKGTALFSRSLRRAKLNGNDFQRGGAGQLVTAVVTAASPLGFCSSNRQQGKKEI